VVNSGCSLILDNLKGSKYLQPFINKYKDKYMGIDITKDKSWYGFAKEFVTYETVTKGIANNLDTIVDGGVGLVGSALMPWTGGASIIVAKSIGSIASGIIKPAAVNSLNAYWLRENIEKSIQSICDMFNLNDCLVEFFNSLNELEDEFY
jgi:hypothetical protein